MTIPPPSDTARVQPTAERADRRRAGFVLLLAMDLVARTGYQMGKSPLLSLVAAALVLAASTVQALAAFETRATAAWIYDLTNDTVLYEKNADVPLPPASMSKIMTLFMLFEALHDGRVTLDTEFRVSDRAHAMGGSTMFLDQTDRPKNSSRGSSCSRATTPAWSSPRGWRVPRTPSRGS